MNFYKKVGIHLTVENKFINRLSAAVWQFYKSGIAYIQIVIS